MIRPHDTRHGAASMMIAAGVPIETVSLILGHSTSSTTRQIYTHTLRGPAAAALEAAAALVRGDGGAQSVHTEALSSEVEEVIAPHQRRSERPDLSGHPDSHCITNSVK
jgi:Phage integrase family